MPTISRSVVVSPKQLFGRWLGLYVGFHMFFLFSVSAYRVRVSNVPTTSQKKRIILLFILLFYYLFLSCVSLGFVDVFEATNTKLYWIPYPIYRPIHTVPPYSDLRSPILRKPMDLWSVEISFLRQTLLIIGRCYQWNRCTISFVYCRWFDARRLTAYFFPKRSI